ncbi:hypothetical protein [Terricaulis sp.]|uniref:hypothetical protein n=1 Tax=Terricaulis sp. TaxID=2768686 RepID=UPI00378355DD
MTIAPASADQVPKHVRPINFAGIELLLDLLHEARQFYGDVDLESLLILLCVSDATMRSFMLEPATAQMVLQDPTPPDALRGSISRRAIADKLGLPRETVRRKTSRLAAAGMISVDADDRVRIFYGLAHSHAWAAVERGHRAILRYLDRLAQLGLDPMDITREFST